jgi:TP901 family phage tail tape measure protein
MADNLITTNITANADFTGLRTQLAATTAQLLKLQEVTAGTNAKLASQIAVMNKSFATTLTSTGQFSQHFVSLTSDVEKFGRNLDRGRLKLNDYYNTWSGHTKKTSNLVRDLAKQQVMLQQAIIQPVGKNAQGLMQYNVMVAKGLDEVKNKTAIARQELAIMNKVMNDGATGLINWGKNTQWAGRQLTVGLTVPLAAFGMAAQKAFKEADQELVRLTKVYGGLSAVSATELGKVRKDVSDTAREIAGSYGIAYKDTIALAADLAATGQQGQALLEATKETSRLAVLGEVDRQEAMKATLAIQNAFKQSTDELSQSIDFLNAVENQTSTSLADLVEAIPKAGPVVKSLGGDVKDLALYLTAMKEGGVNASEGANAIKSAMASLINPTKVAKEMFNGFGIDIDNIVTSNAGNLTATIVDLQSALDNLDPLSKSRAIEQLFGKFQYARMSALFENLGKEGSQTLQVMDLMKASATDLANISSRELGMMTESASGKFKRALASVQADLATVGNQFLVISTKVLEVVDGIIKFFQKLPQPVKTFLNVLGGITAVSGPIIMLAGVMGNFIGYVIKGIFHLKQLARGGQGFKLLTPEIMAADAAAKGLATSFYSDTEATVILTNAVNTLAASFENLNLKAAAASVAVQPGISTVAGGVIAAGTPGGQRYVDKNNPLVGEAYSRDMSHMIPAQTQQPGTIFGTVPGASPVNVRIGKNPQAYMNADMPKIPGVTSVNGISTGVVAAEAAKWHAMTAAIAMQSEAEIKVLKAEVMATGTVTSGLSDSYQALLPQFSEITQLAALETEAIVKQLQASKITVDQARAKVIQLNATVEAMLAETTAATATAMGRTANLTTVPFTSQPVTDPLTGKSNMKEMFHKGSTKNLVDRIARALGGVRTSGAGYNIQTTKPKFARGGIVPGTGNTDTYHTTAEPGAFVINKKSTEQNMSTVKSLLGGTPRYATGGQVPVVLTPGEAVIPANIAQKNMPLMYSLNGGPGNTSGMGRFDGGKIRAQAEQNIRGASAYVSRLSIPKNFLEDTQVRHVMHDAAVLNKLGMSEVESIRTAKRLYDEARQYAYDPKTDTINDERMLEIKEKQTRELDKKIGGGLLKKPLRSGSGKMTPTPAGNRNSAVHPSPSLLATLTKMGFANPGEVKRLQMELFGRSAWDPASQKWIPNTHGYTTEHDIRAAKYGYSATGNFGQAQAGNKDINSWTNTFSKLTQGSDNPFEDRLPQTETEKRMAIDKIGKILGLGTGPGTEERIIKAPTRLKHNFGITKIFMDFLKSKKGKKFNSGGQIPGEFAQKLFRGGKAMFLGMPKTIKQVEAQRAAKTAMEKASQAVKDSRFSKTPVTDYDELLQPTSGRSFPVPGIGGVYGKGGDKVFVKPVLDERAALAELRATEIARDVHGLQTPNQRVVVMRDPTDPTGKRRILALESKYNPAIANQDGKFTTDQYFRQLVASSLRGDKDLGRGNLSGNILADVGPAGVFSAASGDRSYSATMPSFKHQAMVNLMGVKGSGAKKFFAESTAGIPKGMTADQYNDRMLKEINEALPKLKQTISRFDLNAEEKVVYNAMIQRLSDARRQTYGDLHGVHSSLKMSPEKTMTPAAIAKMVAADELKRRQKGHSVSLSDNSFKTSANGFMAGGMIGNILKGKAMHRIGAGFGPTGAPKPSMYESAPWGVNSLSIKMAETLFASTGLRKNTQKLFYDKFAAALAKEKPYGYVKDAQGSLKHALEPEVLDSVIRSAASDLIGDRAVLSQLSPIDKDILRKKFLNWESKKDTPLTDSLKQVIFGLEKREMGGPVNAGQPYVVGEKGPEVFVPRNAGGIVPNNKYGIGGMIGPMIAAMVAQILGGKIGGMGGTALSTLGGIIPFMMMGGGGGQKERAAGFRTYADATSNRQMGPVTSRMGGAGSFLSKSLPGAGKAALKADALEASGSKLAPMFGRIAMMATRANLVVGGLALTFALGAKRLKDHNEHLRIGATQYGLTEEAAKKAGLKFTDYNSKLADTVKNIEAIKERNQMLYESMQDAGLPISMTIEDYKKLRKEVKETYTDQIKLINQSKESDLPQVAVNIKTALMAAGMSADEASKKIFAMFKLSDQAEKAGAFTVGNRAFKNIKTGQDAAESAINNYVSASGNNGREGAKAVNTGLMAIQAGIIDEIEKSKKAAKADKSGNTKVLTEYQAQEAMLKKLNQLESSKAVLTAGTRAEMIKQNPELKKIIHPMDTVVSLFEKMSLGAKGFTGDLSQLGAEAVSNLSMVADSVAASVAAANKEGLLKKNYAALKKLTDQRDVLEKAAKGQSAQKQIDTKNELKRLQTQIDANNKLADARLRALDAAKQEGDIGREIAKKQAEYNAAIATGNTAGAQQASLDMEGLQSTLQYNSQKKAIEDSTKLANAPLEAKIKAINAGQEKMSDNAAIAAESLAALNKKIATQTQQINDVNLAMTTLRINAYELGMTLEEYAKTPDGKAASGGVVGSVNKADPSTIVTPKLQLKRSARVNNPSVPDQALGFMGKVEGEITKGLAAKGITVGAMTGDININGKKMDVGPTKVTAKINSVPTTIPQGSGTYSGSTFVHPSTLSAAGATQTTSTKNGRPSSTWIGVEFLDKDGKKWKVTGDAGGVGLSVQPVKAGYGTMKLNPKVPTIVGDRGPEMAFGGMVIPNMAKLPFASPRYDVGQAAKMFEPMGDSKGGGNVINLTQNIYPAEGMNTDAFVRQVVSMTKDAIGQDVKLNAKMKGNPMNVSIKT